jgi:hypothetical protein
VRGPVRPPLHPLTGTDHPVPAALEGGLGQPDGGPPVARAGSPSRGTRGRRKQSATERPAAVGGAAQNIYSDGPGVVKSRS